MELKWVSDAASARSIRTAGSRAAYTAPGLTDTAVMRADEGVVLPVYVAAHLFEDRGRPQVGEQTPRTLRRRADATSPVSALEQGSQE